MKRNSFTVAEFTVNDYRDAIALWKRCEGIGLSSADTEKGIAKCLQRNPGMSFVVRDDKKLVATILCGNDGRRGYIHHLAVHSAYRRKGIGERLVKKCINQLQILGIKKCHLFILKDNKKGKAFWKRIGWTIRKDIAIMSMDICTSKNR